MQFTIDQGSVIEARQVASPNFDSRPEDTNIDLLVLHCISLPPAKYGDSHIENFFCNQLDVELDPYFKEIQGLKVSSHLLVRRDGELVQFVNLNDRAWHAGKSLHCGREACNDFSIGIELEGTDVDTFTDKQYETLVAITVSIMNDYPRIVFENIVGHQHIAPDRKTDPGEKFDWDRYHALLSDRMTVYPH